MFKLVKKWWKYLTAKLTGSFEERADPKVQLEQAITEAQDQHRRLKEQAANVIANQKQSELRLNAKLGELEKLNANARQALIMAADAEKAGNAEKAQSYSTAAETIANQLIQVEKDVESLKSHGARVGAGVRSGEGGGQPEQPAAAAEDLREVQAAQPARPGEDAGGDELGDGPAAGERGRGCAVVLRGRAEDPGALRQGQGHGRAHRDVRRVQRARDRAGDGERRGPEPAQRAARRARLGEPAPRPRRAAVEQPAEQPAEQPPA